MMKRSRVWFVLLHAALLLLIPLFFFYSWAVEQLPPRMSGCLLHDLLLLYCPMCGGTRALHALLSFDVLSAFRYNAVLTLSIAAFLVLDAVAWYRFFKGKEPYLRMPAWGWILFASLLVAFFVLRNLLMILFGFDPTGDLGALWRIIMKR